MTKPTSIFHQVQQIICDQLNSDDVLSASGVKFIPENSKDIEYEIQNALGRQGIVGLCMVPKADYIGITARGEVAYDLRDLTIQIVENVPVNRGLPNSTTALDAAQRAQEILASPNFTAFGVMNPVSIEQGEDSGLIVCQAKFNCNVHAKYIDPKTTKVKFVDGTEGDYLIEGAMDCPALVDAGLMPPGSGTEQEPSWIKQPLEVNIGSAVTSIGNYAFESCSGLTGVSIPDSVTSIDSCAFRYCIGLTSVTIPDSVTSIGDGAFNYCIRLTSVIMPNSVTSIGNYAFESCSGLTDVTFSGKDKSTVQDTDNYSWGLPSGCVIHCTDGDITL